MESIRVLTVPPALSASFTLHWYVFQPEQSAQRCADECRWVSILTHVPRSNVVRFAVWAHDCRLVCPIGCAAPSRLEGLEPPCRGLRPLVTKCSLRRPNIASGAGEIIQACPIAKHISAASIMRPTERRHRGQHRPRADPIFSHGRHTLCGSPLKYRNGWFGRGLPSTARSQRSDRPKPNCESPLHLRL